MNNRMIINGRELEFIPGEKVVETALRHGVRIEQPCGGKGTCGKCSVQVRHGSEDERLACQTTSEGGMIVTTRHYETNNTKILEFASLEAGDISPEVTSSILPSAFGCDEESAIYGVAVDIGTTTLAASLLDLKNGQLIGSASALNPQSLHGGDVISRIAYVIESSDGLATLQKEAAEAIDALVGELVRGAGISTDEIFHLIAAGNTTMEHCFWGVSPESIGVAPFAPQFYRADRRRASEMGLRIHPSAFVDMVPNITGHIGGDLVSGIFATGMFDDDSITLLIDIGTNNEMILGSRAFMLAASTAAGPALEGAKIRDGMRAANGAIEHVHFENGEVRCSVIGGTEATGICGSGLVDIVCGMLETGVLSPNGRILSPDKIPDNPYSHLVVETEQGKEFRVARNRNGRVAITQKDIREVQLAKGAILTGVDMLLDKAGLTLGQVDRVLLAGAFGSYMDRENAVSLGIIPDVEREKIQLVGNAAGLGCMKALLHKDALDVMERIAKRTEHLELATSAEFQDKFVKNLAFADLYKESQL